MSSQSKRDSLQSGRALRARADLLQDVGALDGPFQASAVPEHAHADLKKLRRTPFIKASKTASDGHGRDVNEYRLTADAHEYLREYVDDRETMLPCGHAGIQNHGDHYRCSYDGCDRQFGAAEVDA